jgi:hypothetical protein
MTYYPIYLCGMPFNKNKTITKNGLKFRYLNIKIEDIDPNKTIIQIQSLGSYLTTNVTTE